MNKVFIFLFFLFMERNAILLKKKRYLNIKYRTLRFIFLIEEIY